MKYEMQVWVSVSADSVHDAHRIIKAQVEKRDGSYRKSEVTYIDSEDLKAEPECGDCGAVLVDVTLPDGTLCEPCGKRAAGTEAEAVR